MDRLTRTLHDLAVFPPERLESRALLRRVDTKFLCPADALPELLPALGRDYGLLLAGGEPLARYRTLYFDSAERRFYHQHRRGRRDRFKVRIRHYLDRSLSMLEVKRKSNHGVTTKERRPRDFEDAVLSPLDRDYVAEHAPCGPDEMVPQVWTDFRRVTLVGQDVEERLTIDLGLEFVRGDERVGLPGTAIIEVKQPHFHPRSPAMLALRDRSIRPSRMSKYCTAQATLFPELRQNRFRPVLRAIRRMNHV